MYVSRYDGTLVYREKGIPQLFQVEQHGYQCFLYRKDTRALTLFFFQAEWLPAPASNWQDRSASPAVLERALAANANAAPSEKSRHGPAPEPFRKASFALHSHVEEARGPPPPPNTTHTVNHPTTPHTIKRTHTNVLPLGNLYAVYRTLLCLHEGPRALYMLCIWKRTTVCTHTLTHTHHKQRICARIRAHTHTRSHAHLASQPAPLVTFDEIENIDVPPTHLINSTGRRVRRGR